jgi:predicted  nucleic acid-binding Zn-ribbon protein
MSDTPRTNLEAFFPHESMYQVCDADFCRQLERELNAANERIKRLEAVTNDPHALWVNWLRGSVALPVGIGDVREYQDRIKRLEEALMDTKNKHAALVADVALYEDRGERIKRLEEVLDEVYHAGRVGASLRAEKAWNKAKEAKP